MQIAGPGAALADSRIEPLDPGDPLLVRVASVGGYVLAKAAAAIQRKTLRDRYDFWWVVLHAPGGPADVAAALRQPHLARHLAWQMPALQALMAEADAEGDGPQVYADTMLRLGSAASRDMLIQDVVAGARLLRRGLDTGGAGPAITRSG